MTAASVAMAARSMLTIATISPGHHSELTGVWMKPQQLIHVLGCRF